MGLKSLILLNRNNINLFFNNSFNGELIYNRVFFIFIVVSKLILNYFDNFVLFNVVSKFKIFYNYDINNKKSKCIFFGKINLFIFQKWFIIIINSISLKIKKQKILKYNSMLTLLYLKKKKIEI